MIHDKLEGYGTITKIWDVKHFKNSKMKQEINVELDIEHEKAVPLSFWNDNISILEDARVVEGDNVRFEAFYSGRETQKEGKWLKKIFPSFNCVTLEKLETVDDGFIADDDFPMDFPR